MYHRVQFRDPNTVIKVHVFCKPCFCSCLAPFRHISMFTSHIHSTNCDDFFFASPIFSLDAFAIMFCDKAVDALSEVPIAKKSYRRTIPWKAFFLPILLLSSPKKSRESKYKAAAP